METSNLFLCTRDSNVFYCKCSLHLQRKISERFFNPSLQPFWRRGILHTSSLTLVTFLISVQPSYEWFIRFACSHKCCWSLLFILGFLYFLRPMQRHQWLWQLSLDWRMFLPPDQRVQAILGNSSVRLPGSNNISPVAGPNYKAYWYDQFPLPTPPRIFTWIVPHMFQEGMLLRKPHRFLWLMSTSVRLLFIIRCICCSKETQMAN